MTANAQLDFLLESVPAPTPENFGVREDMLSKARRLAIALERPDNSIERVCFGIWEGIAIRVAVDTGLLRQLRERSPQSVEELAASVAVDPTLLERLLRCLASFNVLKQTSPREFSATEYSKAFSDPQHEPTIIAAFGFLMHGWLAVPDFLKANQYRNPSSGTNTAFAKAFGRPEGATVWELLSQSPYLGAMGGLMKSYHSGHRNWMDIYPVQDRLIEGAKTDDSPVLMVDVGGGLGQQAVAFREKFENSAGRVIVQDLAQGLPAERDSRVEYQQHDFMTAQPIKGARLYYLRWVLHDWSQEICVDILKNLAGAMTPSYSKLIINEWIVPEMAPSTYMATADLNMMSFGGGMERTEAMHRKYIEQAGCKLIGIWRPGDSISESVIEVEVA